MAIQHGYSRTPISNRAPLRRRDGRNRPDSRTCPNSIAIQQLPLGSKATRLCNVHRQLVCHTLGSALRHVGEVGLRLRKYYMEQLLNKGVKELSYSNFDTASTISSVSMLNQPTPEQIFDRIAIRVN